MSRPPGREHSTRLGEQYYDHPIDFIGNQYDQSDCHNSYIMAKAGFPGYGGYSNQMPSGYAINAGYTTPTYTTGQQVIATGYPQTYPQGYPQTTIASPVVAAQCHPGMSLAQGMVQGVPMTQGMPLAQSMPATTAARPLESEAAVQERIKANIDAIMETQKTAMLNSKLESLTNKVQSLAQNIEKNIEHNESSKVRSLADKVDRLSQSLSCESDSSIKALSEKVDRLSRNLEQRPAATESLSSAVPNSDNDIARRLRRLAAESSTRKSEERIPDW
jgi:hypothetical protein